MCAVGGLFPGRFFETHKGVGMGTYVPDTMKGKENDGWGGAIETPPSHAGLSGVIGACVGRSGCLGCRSIRGPSTNQSRMLNHVNLDMT